MLLAVDIGNTIISFGFFRGKRMMKRVEVPAGKYSRRRLSKLLGKAGVNDALICSVVPQKTPVLKRDLKRLLGREPYIIGKEIKVPLRNLYRRPREVGQDRLVNAYAAVVFYAAPAVVIDLGTAVTFDVISANKEYMGGMILPGIEISLQALCRRAALLPKIKLGRPGEFIGRDTKSSMISGIVYGFAALIDQLAIRIKEKIGRKAKVIGTGGNIRLLGNYCRRIDKIDKDLTLKGLNLIYGHFSM